MSGSKVCPARPTAIVVVNACELVLEVVPLSVPDESVAVAVVVVRKSVVVLSCAKEQLSKAAKNTYESLIFASSTFQQNQNAGDVERLIRSAQRLAQVKLNRPVNLKSWRGEHAWLMNKRFKLPRLRRVGNPSHCGELGGTLCKTKSDCG